MTTHRPTKQPHTLAEIDNLLNWPSGWNTYDALAPNPLAVAHAKEWITELYRCVEQWQLQWLAPNVTACALGDVVFEWWKGQHKVTVLVGAHVVVIFQVTGKDITDCTLSKASECETIWRWLVGEEQS